MTSKRTARIARERIEKTKLKMEGVCWRKAIIYVKMNRHLTSGISQRIRKYMPVRKSKQGVEPGMASKCLRGKEGSELTQWIFPRRTPSEDELKEIIGLVAEIGIRVLWENYCYDFGGKTYQQAVGGPIGKRTTMAASRIVMADFFCKYNDILARADLKITLMKVYVDDGRQITSLMKKGMRYNAEKNEFQWSKEAEEEDEKLEKEGESKETFMARLCLPAMNAINKDLTFTAEVADDFPDKKLPTLDLNLWMKEDLTVSHTYFEKEMKSQLMIERGSAMGKQQKYCILANELTRRLLKIDTDSSEEVIEEEVVKITEHYTRQVKNSGWSVKEAKEIIVSGYAGWVRKMRQRREGGEELYRSAAASLPARVKNKLIGKETWFKKKSIREKDEFDTKRRAGTKRKWTAKAGEDEEDEARTVGVMFVPYTLEGELARRMREAEKDLGKQTGIKLKIVERTGSKLVDLLHRADPWQGQDCQRPLCILCNTKQITEKHLRQDCTKRSIVYETWCLSCEESAKKAIEEDEGRS